ncbi:MAG: hypothetical protein NTW75_11005 [Planctomycetales bacterium]|nr:hypothetical protein [Planctomycetales bacterium]
MLSFGNSICCSPASWGQSWLVRFGCLGLSSAAVGCVDHSQPAKPPHQVLRETATEKTSSPSSQTSHDTNSAARSARGPSSESGRKSGRGIPYDAFFEDPLSVANDPPRSSSMTAAGTNVGTKGREAAPDSNRDSLESSPIGTDPLENGADGFEWSNLIPLEILLEEAEHVRDLLATSMQATGTYNREYKDIAWNARLLAGLAAIVLEHDQQIASWRDRGHLIRDLSNGVASAAVGPGRLHYESSKTAFDKLDAAFRNSVPPGAEEIVRKRPFHQSLDRTGLMKRIEKSYDWLRLNIVTEAKIKSEQTRILKEASLIAALGKVVSAAGYPGADETDYQRYAADLVAGGSGAKRAAAESNYQKFHESIIKIGKSCAECHPQYAQ